MCEATNDQCLSGSSNAQNCTLEDLKGLFLENGEKKPRGRRGKEKKRKEKEESRTVVLSKLINHASKQPSAS